MEMGMLREEVLQQSAASILLEEIQRYEAARAELQRKLESHHQQTRARFVSAEASLAAAQTEFEAAQAADQEASSLLSRYSFAPAEGFEPTTALALSAPAPTPKLPAVKARRDDVIATPQSQPSSMGGPRRDPNALTVPERLAAVMGDGVWDAGKLELALADAGTPIISNNPRSYLLGTLSTSMIRIPGPDGKDLRDSAGKFVRVHKFTAVERGKYRVATAEDIQREIGGGKLVGPEPESAASPETAASDIQLTASPDVKLAAAPAASDEPIFSRTRTPADEVFEEQGIEIRSAVADGRY